MSKATSRKLLAAAGGDVRRAVPPYTLECNKERVNDDDDDTLEPKP